VIGGGETSWQAIKVTIKMIVVIPMIERLEFIVRMTVVFGVRCDV
jgi:hypothetical protein